MKKTVSALLLLLLLSGCGAPASVPPPTDSPSNTSQNEPSSANEDVFLEFTAKDFDGNEVDHSIFANTKLTMMNVWATFCSPCVTEMPELGELAAVGGTDYQIIGVCADLDNTAEMLQEAKDIVAETGANYVHLQPSESLLPVLTATSAVPVTFFFDSEGKLVGQGVMGARDKSGWEKELKARLEAVHTAAQEKDAAATPESTEDSSDAAAQ
ncbi:MAG: TlpA family protein disulfide reductase [Butyricicoccus pullicaecorum]|nr:TlpA family protein disulfide reductase [Butyricicoccus pullicaecorum]